MEKLIAPRSLGATTAIAAVFALSSIPAFAQEAAPQDTVTLPATQPAVPAAPAPATTPTIVLPSVDATPQPASPPAAEPAATPPSASEVQTPTQTAQTAEAPAARAERATRATPAGTPRVPTATDAGTARDGTLARGDAPPAVTASPQSDTPAAMPAPAGATAPATGPTSAARATDEDGLSTAGIVGLVAALGVAGAGIAMMLRRRRPAEADYVEEPAEPEPTPAAMADPMALASNPPARLGPSAEALAAGPVPIGDDRQALLDAMVAAQPDEANPFTSRKARLRRARLILQHREHLQMQGKPFDWRTYRPTTRPSNPSPTETLVEA